MSWSVKDAFDRPVTLGDTVVVSRSTMWSSKLVFCLVVNIAGLHVSLRPVTPAKWGQSAWDNSQTPFSVRKDKTNNKCSKIALYKF